MRAISPQGKGRPRSSIALVIPDQNSYNGSKLRKGGERYDEKKQERLYACGTFDRRGDYCSFGGGGHSHLYELVGEEQRIG